MRSTGNLASPLSQTQKTVWSMITKGLSTTIIADKLSTTRQFVNQTKLAAEAKLSAIIVVDKPLVIIDQTVFCV